LALILAILLFRIADKRCAQERQLQELQHLVSSLQLPLHDGGIAEVTGSGTTRVVIGVD
jgi:hypothetical protein